MSLKISLLAVLLYLHCNIRVTLQQKGVLCPTVDNAPGCVCDMPDGSGIIDLRPLGSTDGTPRFTGMSDPNNYNYDFNPCTPFTSSGECASPVYICQSFSLDDTKFAIADSGSEGIYIDGTTVSIYYTGPGNRQTYVKLVCDETDAEPYVTTTGDSQEYLVYAFTLTSKYACPGAGGGGGGGSKAGVAGIVIMLLIILGIVAYFGVGAVVMRIHYQKTGTDLIIHKIFWFALPGLIKEGFVFTFAPCFKAIKGMMNKNQGYKAEL